ncbi:phage portal protein [Paracraurococcus lichenis]|uniref:Phage portal protein n=1 Tax=Paracraurococcus lichenis TaxID=3064888 RepID=A0ABT9ECR5_9PROT|nr:phage portal protein [Paracraurococcus sp. LOR1-02]MDO9713825.1 phage portal protein [Paracraurococcus sp. LOR1-02]
MGLGGNSAFTRGPTAAGQLVNARIAENLATVTACVDAVASSMASLPPRLYRRVPGGRQEVMDHPVAALLRRPSQRQTWPDLVQWLMSQVLLHGNALAVVEHDGAGRPTGLVPVPWQNVAPMLLPSGRLAHDVVAYTSAFGGTGLPRRYLDGEVFHLRDRSDDGLLGRSRLSRAPEVLGCALAVQEAAGAMLANGASLSGVVSVDAPLDRDTAAALREMVQETYGGARNTRRIGVFGHGAKFTPMSVSPEDAELLASRRFTVEELARLFGVPAPIIGDLSHGTFSNSETLIRFFAQSTLTAWCTKFEAEWSRSVLGLNGADLELELDLTGLLRGDPAQRWQSYAIAAQHSILDLNEIRELEGFNPRRDPAAGGAA